MDIKELINKKENPKLDFKRQWYKEADVKTEFIKDVIALTNGNIHSIGQNSFLIIGVKENDKGNEFYDIREDERLNVLLDKSLDIIKSQLLQNLQNYIEPAIQDIHMEEFKVDSKTILVIQIPFHPYPIILKDKLRQHSRDTMLYRAGEGTVEANYATRRAFDDELDKYRKHSPNIHPLTKITNDLPRKIDNKIVQIDSDRIMSDFEKIDYDGFTFTDKVNSKINIDELNWELIQKYTKSKEFDIDFSLERKYILEELNFSIQEKIINGVILNFANRPDKFIPQAHVVVVLDTYTNTHRFYGSNIELLKQTLTFLEDKLERLSYRDDEGVRIDDLVIPKDVLREALSNALVHRCYENCNKPIRVTLLEEKKKITIESPGDFLGDYEKILLEEDNDYSNSRDAKMNDYLIHLGGAEGVGTGFKFFREYLKKEGEKAVSFKSDDKFTKIILKFQKRESIASKIDKTINISENSYAFNSENNAMINFHSPIVSRQLTSLPPLNTNFIGREVDLKAIEKNLSSDNVVCVVNGIGGVGKSELSYRYLHKHKEEYNKIAFIEFTEESRSLEETFYFKFKDIFKLTEHDTFESIIKRLQDLPKPNLMVLDNLLNNEDFKKIKALNSNFDLLITTREKLDSPNILNLETLNPSDAKELFLSIYSKDEQIDDILKYLDNHPLFITLTAYSLNEEYIELDELRADIVNGKVTEIDSKDDKTFQETLFDTFDRQFKNEQNNELKAILQILALFPAIEIEFEMLKQIIADKKLKIKLQKLVARGWLSKKENSYKLHQIIKTFILTSYPPEYENVTFILENIGNYIDPYDYSLIANKLSDYIPIVDSLLELFKDKKDEPIAKILDSNTFLYYSLGEYENSLKMQQESLLIREVLYDQKSEFIAKSYNLLGRIYDTKGEYDKSELLYKKALEIYEKVLGENHPNTASTYNDLAEVFRIKREYGKSESFFKKALKIREEILGESHPDTAIGYDNLAHLYYSQKEYDKSELLFKKALKIREEILGESHPDTASSYNNLAELFHLNKEHSKSELLFKKALKIREEILGENHPDIASSYRSLGFFYKEIKRCTKAKEYLEKAIASVDEMEYSSISLIDLRRALREVEKSMAKEKKAKFNKKWKFCVD